MKRKILGLILILTVLTLSLPRTAHATLTWSFPGTNLTNDQNVDVMPAMVRTPNNTLITAYTSVVGTSIALYGQVYSNTTGWSQRYRLTSEDPNQDTSASLAVFGNGTALIAWQTNRTGSNDIMVGLTDGTRIWNPQAIVANTTNDGNPSVAITKNGSVWLFWTRETAQLGPYYIYYKTLIGGVWSQERLLATGNSLNSYVSALAAKDDRVWLVFAERNTSSQWQLFAASNTNGTWSSNTQIVSSSNNDVTPGLSQDRAGNIWVIWSREIPVGINTQYLLFSTFSSDNGASFPSSNQAQITFDSTGTRDDIHPSVVQGLDKTLWVEYSSDPTSSSGMIFNVWIGRSTAITGVHDVGVSHIRSNSTRWLNGGVGTGANVTVSVLAADPGDYPETTTLTLYGLRNFTQTLLGSKSIALSPGTTLSVSFQLLTKTLPLGNYTFKATVIPAPGESLGNQGDDSLVEGAMRLTQPQDLDRDYDIDVNDLVLIFTHEFTSNLAYDVNFDSKVDVLDLINVWQHQFITITIVHDVGVRSIAIPPYIYRGQTINVNVTVVNEGQGTESFSIYLYYNKTTNQVASTTITSLTPGATLTVSIPWNTTNTPGVSSPRGGCFLSVSIPALPSETHTSDNNLTIQYPLANCVRKTGDVDLIPDGTVDVSDVIAVWQHEFTTLAQYDVTGDGVVDVRDVIATFVHEFT